MKTRINRKNGSKMSILGFGCMRLPSKNGNIDEQRSIELIRSAARAGVNYFDTAYIYQRGKSEVLLGKALAGDLRRQQTHGCSQEVAFFSTGGCIDANV